MIFLTILLKQQSDHSKGTGHAIVLDIAGGVKNLILNAVQPSVLQSSISNFTTSNYLNDTLLNYVKTTDLTTTLSNYVKTNDLNTALLIYAKSSDLQPYARLSDLQKNVKDRKYSNTAIYPAAFDGSGKNITL